MQISDIIPDLLSHYNVIGDIAISQTLVASILGNIVFFVFVRLFIRQKKQKKISFFTQTVSLCYEKIYEFLAEIGGKQVTSTALTYTTTLFIYVLRQNIFGLIGDMIVLVWPLGHERFRPATTDIMFNGLLAFMVIVGSFIFGFSQHGLHFISKYLPHKGMGLVGKIDKRRMVIPKFFDILLGLLIGLIELMGEFGRILSLSLRLFGNMFVGMLLLTLLLHALGYITPIPLIGPAVVFGYELAVSFLQALIFSVLATIYCKLAGDAH